MSGILWQEPRHNRQLTNEFEQQQKYDQYKMVGISNEMQYKYFIRFKF